MKILSFFLEIILINRFLVSLLLISTGIQAAYGRECSFLFMSEIDFFGSSSPCLKACKKANHKCEICAKKSGRSREICLAVRESRYVEKCKSCMRNPHGLPEDQMKGIKRLNDLKLGSKSEKIRASEFGLHLPM